MAKKRRDGSKGARQSRATRTQKQVELVRPEGLAFGEERQKMQVPEDTSSGLASASIAIGTLGQAKENQRTTPKGGAYVRGASRARQTMLHRKPSALITPEQYTYVKRDLIHIAILSSGMVGVMIVLAFILGIE